MSFWIAVILISALTLYFLSRPLRKRPQTEEERADFDLTIFKDQLKELDRDLERGLISSEEAETARLEIQRRLLAADQNRSDSSGDSDKMGKTTLVVASFIGLIVIVGSLGLYTRLGMPGYGDMPFAERDFAKERQMAARAQSGNMVEEINRLKQRLTEKPDDVDSWVLLARSLRSVGRNEESLQAYKGALAASGRHPAVLADYAEALIYANQGDVNDETRALLEEAIEKDPAQLKALFYSGFAQARAQDFKSAIQTWTDVIALAPPQAQWVTQVREQITMAAKAGNLNPDDFTPSPQVRVLAKQFALEWEEEDQQAAPQPGPTKEQMQDAAEMTPEERQDMIRSMVQRLADRVAENPDDLAGWQRLVQVYGVLGETEKQAEAKAMVDRLSR